MHTADMNPFNWNDCDFFSKKFCSYETGSARTTIVSNRLGWSSETNFKDDWYDLLSIPLHSQCHNWIHSINPIRLLFKCLLQGSPFHNVIVHTIINRISRDTSEGQGEAGEGWGEEGRRGWENCWKYTMLLRLCATFLRAGQRWICYKYKAKGGLKPKCRPKATRYDHGKKHSRRQLAMLELIHRTCQKNENCNDNAQPLASITHTTILMRSQLLTNPYHGKT